MFVKKLVFRGNSSLKSVVGLNRFINRNADITTKISNFLKPITKSLSYLNLKFYFNAALTHGYHQKKKFFLNFFFLKKYLVNRRPALNTVGGCNAYFKRLSQLDSKKQSKSLVFKEFIEENPEYVSVNKNFLNKNFLNKNFCKLRNNTASRYNIFSTLDSVSFLPMKLLVNIEAASRAYQNILLYNVVKNKELLYQISYIYEFESDMLDVRSDVYFNKLKKLFFKLSRTYGNKDLVVKNFFTNVRLIDKMWSVLKNKNYLYISPAQFYFLGKDSFMGILLFV